MDTVQRQKTFCLGSFVVIAAFLLCIAQAVKAEQYRPAIVTEGAFLLSKYPDTVRDEIKVHHLVGYLPTGTKVYVGNQHILNNLSKGEKESYNEIVSDIGVTGLLREDLFVLVENRPVAVTVASYEIPIHQPYASLQKPSVRFTLGRYGGNYLEITGEEEEGFYDVILHRAHPVASLPATEPGRLKKEYAEKGHVIITYPQPVDSRDADFPVWTAGAPLEAPFIDELLQKVRDKLGDDLDTARSFLQDLNALQCMLSSNAKAAFGFTFFSNGLSFNLDLNFKDASQMYLFDRHELKQGGDTRLFTMLRTIHCDGSSPDRLFQITLQEGLYDLDKRVTIRLKDLSQAKSKWITTLQGREVPLKMIRISGWPEYQRTLRELENLASSGTSYLGTLSGKDRRILLNFILTQIAYFEHREMIE